MRVLVDFTFDDLKTKKYDSTYVISTLNMAEEKLYYGGWIFSKGFGSLFEIQYKVNDAISKDIMQYSLLRHLRKCFCRNYLFKHDNDPKNVRKIIKL